MAITFVDSTSSTSTSSNYTLNKPTGLAEGDLLIAAISIGSVATQSTITPPSGWTLASAVAFDEVAGAFGNTLGIVYKTATGSEPSTWGGSVTGSPDVVATAVAAYRGAADDSEQFIDIGASSNEGGTLTTATVNNTDSDAWRVTCGGSESTDGTNTWTTNEVSEREEAGATSSNGVSVLLADSNGSVGTGNTSRTVDYSGSEDVHTSLILLIKPGLTTVTGTVDLDAIAPTVSVDADAEVSASASVSVPIAEASVDASLTVSGSAGVATAAPAVAVAATLETNALIVEAPLAEVSAEGDAEVTATAGIEAGVPTAALEGTSGTAATGAVDISAPAAEADLAGLHGNEGTGTIGMSVFPEVGAVGFVPTPVLFVGEEHQVSSASGGAANLTVAVPTGTLNGDLLLAFVNEIQDSNLTLPPSGWTLLGAQQGSASTNARGTVYYRVANSEPANYTFDDNDSFGWVWGAAILAFRNVDQELNGPIHRSAKQGFGAGETPVTAPSVSTAVRSMILTYMVSVTYDGATAFHSHVSADAGTEAADFGSENDSSSVSGAVYYSEQEIGTHGFTVDPSGGNGTNAGRVAFTIALPELSNVDITMGIDAPAPVVDMSVTAEATATTTMTTEFPGSAYAADATVSGTSAMEVQPSVLAVEGTAAADYVDVNAPMPSVSVDATAEVTGSTTLDLSAPLVDMNGLVFGAGSMVMVAPAVGVQVAGEAEATGSAAMSAPAAQMSVAALSGDPGTGTIGMTVPLSRVALSALHDLFGTVEITTPLAQTFIGVETRIFGDRVKAVDAESRVIEVPIDAPPETFYV